MKIVCEAGDVMVEINAEGRRARRPALFDPPQLYAAKGERRSAILLLMRHFSNATGIPVPSGKGWVYWYTHLSKMLWAVRWHVPVALTALDKALYIARVRGMELRSPHSLWGVFCESARRDALLEHGFADDVPPDEWAVEQYVEYLRALDSGQEPYVYTLRAG